MRPLKELLHILLDEVERNGVGDFGLCHTVILNDSINNNLNEKEKQVLFCFIVEKTNKLTNGGSWLFPKGETAPRIELLKNEIEEL